ncbi:MAG TPA: hypothetical protein VFT22_27280 [Kofleriaceae bacterium]|nr:hypothetical protein [Kofleriaceae bacterium]
MKQALVALAVLAGLPLTGCVTAAGIVQHAPDQEVSLPVLLGATAADLVVTSAAASQIESYSPGASIATGLALTAVDVAIGCLIGACRSLRL